MRIWLTADTHFGHTALVHEFCARPADYESRILRHWRDRVSADDLIIHLGDVIVGSPDIWTTLNQTLPGRKILVLGNHDRKSTSWYLSNGFEFCCREFVWRLYGVDILFSHEPTHEGTFDLNIHGHLHSGLHRSAQRDERHYLVSLEETHYQPVPLKSAVEAWRGGHS